MANPESPTQVDVSADAIAEVPLTLPTTGRITFDAQRKGKW